MSNRVVIGNLPSDGVGLRASTPGRDVLDSDLSGQYLAFDTRWLGTSRVVTMGSVSLSANGGSATRMFGTTLPKPPAVIAMMNVSGNWWSFDNYAGGQEFTSTPSAAAVNAALRPETDAAVDIRDDRVIFRNPNPFAISVSYIVLGI